MDVAFPAKIAKAVDAGYAQWGWARKQRADAVQEIVGDRYGRDHVGSDIRKNAVNLMQQTYVVLLHNLFPDTIKHVCRAKDPRLDFEAKLLGMTLDHRAQEEGLAQTLMLAGVDALLGPCGVVRTGIRAGADLVKIEGRDYDPGALYTARVDLEDYACDPTAKIRREFRWEAVRYRKSRDALIASGIFDPDDIRALPLMNRRRDSSGATISERELGEELIDTVQLWDVFLYSDDSCRCVTMGASFGSDGSVVSGNKILLDYEFEGPESGPLEWLSFYELVANAAPLPPALMWRELHEATAKMADKLVAAMMEAKTIIGYRPAAVDDARTIQKGSHLELLKLDNPADVNVMTVDPVGKNFYQAFDWLSDQGSQAAGNQRLLSGQESTAGSATEASLLNQNADARIKYMRQRVEQFHKRVATQRAWYVVSDPLMQQPLGVRIPGGEFQTMQYTAQAREGDALDFLIDVQPYVPSSGDPAVRLRRINELCGQVLPALLPVLTSGLIAPQAAIRLLSREYGDEDMEDLLGDPMALQQRMASLAMVPGIQSMQGVPGGPVQGYGGNQNDPAGSPIGEVRGAAAPGVPGR